MTSDENELNDSCDEKVLTAGQRSSLRCHENTKIYETGNGSLFQSDANLQSHKSLTIEGVVDLKKAGVLPQLADRKEEPVRNISGEARVNCDSEKTQADFERNTCPISQNSCPGNDSMFMDQKSKSESARKEGYPKCVNVMQEEEYSCRNVFQVLNELKDSCQPSTNISVEKPFRESRRFLCEKCGKLFLRRRNLDRHMLIHLGIQNYGCDLCSRRFYRKDAMKSHRSKCKETSSVSGNKCRKYPGNNSSNKVEKTERVGNFRCHACNKVFGKLAQLHGHMASHGTCSNWLKCEKCDKRFSKKSILEKHRLECFESSQTDSKQYRLRCQQVPANEYNKDFTDGQPNMGHNLGGDRKINLRKQPSLDFKADSLDISSAVKSFTEFEKSIALSEKKLVTPDTGDQNMRNNLDKKIYPCDMCCKRFTTKYYLKEHKSKTCKRMITGNEENIAPLEEKPSLPNSPSSLRDTHSDGKQHLRKYGSTKIYLCDLCGKRFTTKYYLKGHRSTTCKKRFGCDKLVGNSQGTPAGLCDVDSKQENNRGFVMNTAKIKRFKCNVCKEQFRYRYDLNRHSRIHKGSSKIHARKDFMCELCNKMLSTREYLALHMLQYCKKRFERTSKYKHEENKIDGVFPTDVTLCDVNIDLGEELGVLVTDHDRELLCNICNAQCKSVASLKRHFATHKDIKEGFQYFRDVTEKCTSITQETEVSKGFLMADAPVCDGLDEIAKVTARVPATSNHDVNSGLKLCAFPKITYDCPKCCKQFGKIYNLNCHMLTHRVTRNFECDTCKKKFMTKLDLTSHKLEHGKTNDRTRELDAVDCGTSDVAPLNVQKVPILGASKPGIEKGFMIEDRDDGGNLRLSDESNSNKRKNPLDENLDEIIKKHIALSDELDQRKRLNFSEVCKIFAPSCDVKKEESSLDENVAEKNEQEISAPPVNRCIKEESVSKQKGMHRCHSCCKDFRKRSDLNRHLLTKIHASRLDDEIKKEPFSQVITDGVKQETDVSALLIDKDIKDEPESPAKFNSSMETEPSDALGIDCYNNSNYYQITKYRCKTCRKEFNLLVYLRRHMRRQNHIRKGDNGRKKKKDWKLYEIKVFVCSFCQEEFGAEVLLSRHLSTHKRKTTRRQLGIFTESGVISQDQAIKLEVNKKENHPSVDVDIKEEPNWDWLETREHVCSRCGKCFKRKDHLTRHMYIHDGIRKYKCKLCDKRYSQNYRLTRHRITCHNFKSLPCQVCGKCFSTRNTFNCHMLLHCGKRKYSCDRCGMKFTRTQHVKRHQLKSCTVR